MIPQSKHFHLFACLSLQVNTFNPTQYGSIPFSNSANSRPYYLLNQETVQYRSALEAKYIFKNLLEISFCCNQLVIMLSSNQVNEQYSSTLAETNYI